LGEDRCALVSSRRLLYSMRLEESRRLEGSGRQLESFVVWVGLRLEGSDRQMELSIRRLDGPLPQNRICWGFARLLVSPL
jgi:hypothetical protein